ncbi:MAG: propionate CoA-transferase [Deltaproteobacteria bacterium]|jgi:propionate CoA-transferase|nr:propionate CoA-transferase [Deltaproteobacteria bacterium]
MGKRMNLEEALALVQNGNFIASSGFMVGAFAMELVEGLGKRFLETGSPKGLTLMHASGQGNNKDMGHIFISHEGLIKRYICGHFANNKRMIELANEGKVEAYNFPQGVITNLYRAIAAGKPGELTKIGLDTYIDPRMQGGKMSLSCKEDLVELLRVGGKDYLLYKAHRIDIGFIRGTTADENGNISMEEEMGVIDALDVAMAVRASGGKVIAQVKNYVKAGSIPVKDVVVPGIMVDAVVVASNPAVHHRQTPLEEYNPVISGRCQSPSAGFGRLKLDERKIIARRAYLEVKPDSVINLGIGIPEGIAMVANEEGRGGDFVLTVESGMIGGVPGGGPHFGSSYNAWANVPMATQFLFYNGGGLDTAFLGFAEINPKGDINVTRFGPRLAGCGGFVDITQATRAVVFCGGFTAGGFECLVKDGKLVIVQEGKNKKFLKTIEQISFSSIFALREKLNIIYVTERCVFRLTPEGIELTEVAPGIDPERDIYPHMEFKPIVKQLKSMDPRIFQEGLMGV